VFRRLYIALTFILICPLTKAETRWCTISHTGKLVYPPLGRAAHVSGVVIQRINFTTAGSLLNVETISGPQLLAISTADQMKNWHLTTDAAGDEPCQSLILVRYMIHFEDPPPTENLPTTPGMLQISVDAPVLVISDPAGTIRITRKRRFLFF
jgi:hypothetical protein